MKIKELIEGTHLIHTEYNGKPGPKIKVRAIDDKNAEYQAKKVVGKKPYRGYSVSKIERIKESVTITESKMAEIHQSLQDHLDKHINKFKKKTLGHDQFGEHCVRTAHKIAKEHGIEHKDAQKLVNSYVDSKIG